jgi:hypothetical protein
MPRRLDAERRLLHPAVAQRAAVGRKAWIGATKPARSEKSRPAISLRAILVSLKRVTPVFDGPKGRLRPSSTGLKRVLIF